MVNTANTANPSWSGRRTARRTPSRTWPPSRRRSRCGSAAAEASEFAEIPEGPETSEAPEATEAPDVTEAPAPEDAASEEPAPDAVVAPLHDDHPLASYVLRVNGTDRPVTGAWIGESLLYVLRERLGLAGAKDGCSQGECGACNVQVDGRLVASCLVPGATAMRQRSTHRGGPGRRRAALRRAARPHAAAAPSSADSACPAWR